MFATPKVTEAARPLEPVTQDTFDDEAVHIDGSRGPVMPGGAGTDREPQPEPRR